MPVTCPDTLSPCPMTQATRAETSLIWPMFWLPQSVMAVLSPPTASLAVEMLPSSVFTLPDKAPDALRESVSAWLVIPCRVFSSVYS